jgi:hypothetical protein
MWFDIISKHLFFAEINNIISEFSHEMLITVSHVYFVSMVLNSVFFSFDHFGVSGPSALPGCMGFTFELGLVNFTFVVE